MPGVKRHSPLSGGGGLTRELTDLAASVRDRLKALARPGTDEFAVVLVRYGLERLLYRLSRSEWRDRFVLKGAMVFAAWSPKPHRATRDLDLLGYGPPDPQRLRDVFRELCELEVEPDGLTFHADSVRSRRIREQDEYQGIRVTMLVTLKRVRIPLQIDIGTGDKVVPPPEDISYPTLLDMPAPKLKAYSRYTVVAEKLEAMVVLETANSRMRDYYDIGVLARSFEFDGDTLRAALEVTFGRRRVELPSRAPVGLSDGLADSAEKQEQWRAFLRRSTPAESTASLREVVEGIRAFLVPVLSGQAKGRAWRPGKGWRTRRVR